MPMVFHVLSLLLVLLAGAARAQAPSFSGRAPWTPGPPDACSGLAIPCGQLDDFNLTMRAAGLGFWPGPGFRNGGGGSLGATLSFYKTAEIGLSLPIAVVRGGEGGDAAIYGPPELRLRIRVGPRLGPAPWGKAWPASEPYPKALPASYDVRPGRWTAALGLRFVPLWPGVRGQGPIACSASDSGCLAEVGLSLTGDLRLGPVLATGQIEATAAGEHSQLRAGGRVAVNLFDVAALFAEGRFQHEIAHPTQRGGLALVGGQLFSFRGARFSAYYGRAFGGVSGENLAGAQVDVPIGVLWGALQRLSELIDPFVGGDGWLYSDDCRPLFRLGSAQGDRVWDEARKAWIPVGTHLWRRGDRLYFDRDGTLPYGPVRRAEGAPPPLAQGYAEAPWPALRTASAQTPEGRDWLRRYALAPDPRRRVLCEQLMDSVAAGLRRAEEAPTLGDACDNARRMAGAAREAVDADAAAQGHQSGGTVLAGMIAEAALCPPDRQRATGISTAGLPPMMPAGRGRPGAAPGAGLGAAPPPAKAPPAPPPGAGVVSRAPGAAPPPYAPAGYVPPSVATHAPPAPGTPGLRPGPAAPPSVATRATRIPPSRQLPPGPPPRPALPPGPPPPLQLAAPAAPRPASPPPPRSAKATAMANWQRGRNFDKAHTFDYPHREVQLVKPPGAKGNPRLDGYDPGDVIVSRKHTQLAAVQEETAVKYLRQLRDKYPQGRPIAQVPSSGPLAGTQLRGRQILEVPIQNEPVPRRVVQEANNLGIIIRDVNGKEYR